MRPERQAILEDVYRARESIEPHRHLPWAQHVLRIPHHDFYALVRLYPGLIAIDPEEKNAAWARFEKSAFSEPYRVGKVVRGITKNGIIGVPLDAAK